MKKRGSSCFRKRSRWFAKARQRGSGVTLRSLILGTILTVINCYWVISTEIVRTVVIGTVLTVFFNAIFTVFILAALNLLLKKHLPSAVLTQGELLVVYIMVSVSTAIYGIDLMEVMVPVKAPERRTGS